MAEPRRLPVYVVAICDGSGCRDLTVIDRAGSPRQAARWLGLLAARLRGRGALGTLTLTEAATERVVATRRVWP